MSTSNQPLVSIICTCYNHEKFVGKAIRSVFDQTYAPIEVIIIDDRSTDNSLSCIKKVMDGIEGVRLIQNPVNQGICKNFNLGFNLSKGKYLIDLSGDDILLEDCVEKHVYLFESLDDQYGVVFANAGSIDENGDLTGYFYPIDDTGKARKAPPEGDVYSDLISKYFIAAPTMMMRRSVLTELGGYDESLAYEDFDFWIRSSRSWKYKYLDEVVCMIRETKGSLSSKQYHPNDKQLLSTYEVCKKVRSLNRSKHEQEALAKRIRYEIKHAVLADKKSEADHFIKLLSELQPLDTTISFLSGINRSGLKTGWIRDYILKLKS